MELILGFFFGSILTKFGFSFIPTILICLGIGAWIDSIKEKTTS